MSSDSEENGLAMPGSDEFILIPDAQPTYSYHADEIYQRHVVDMHSKVPATQEDPFLGPYYRDGAPFRAKISPPHEPGDTLVIKGRVWSFDEKRPLRSAKIDVWHANADGIYDNEDKKNPLGKNDFRNRARLYCDDNGYYEFETVRPGPYRRRGMWRAAHIHFLVAFPGYIPVVTQLFFKGGAHHNEDHFIKDTLIIKLREKWRHGRKYDLGVFDIVLKRET